MTITTTYRPNAAARFRPMFVKETTECNHVAFAIEHAKRYCGLRSEQIKTHGFAMRVVVDGREAFDSRRNFNA